MKNVLIVEDQSIVRQGLKLMIESDPEFQVVAEASNGLEAIKILEKHVVDVVLMDIRMPVMNGLEQRKKLRDAGQR